MSKTVLFQTSMSEDIFLFDTYKLKSMVLTWSPVIPQLKAERMLSRVKLPTTIFGNLPREKEKKFYQM